MNLPETLQAIQSFDDPALEVSVRARLNSLTKPVGSLGCLEELALWYCLARGERLPAAPQKRLYVFCADHGVAQEDVSAFPAEVTPQMVLNFASGGAAVNVLSRQAGIEAVVVDVGVNADFAPSLEILDRKIARGTANLAAGPAMTIDQAEQALQVGIDCAEQAAASGATLLAGGEMGIANTTSAAAVGAALLGCRPESIVGSGTGVDAPGVARKAAVVSRALARLAPDAAPLEVLAQVGGFEIGALSGLYLGAAARRIPSVVDGFIATAAALLAVRLAPAVRPYLAWGHRSAEQGHRLMLDDLRARPLLDLDMRLGEGSGAAVAMTLVDRAHAVYTEMATFDSAGVSGSD